MSGSSSVTPARVTKARVTTARVTTVKVTTVTSPVGVLTLTAQDGFITGLHMDDQRHAPPASADWEEDDRPFKAVVEQLEVYFSGQLTEFDVPLRMAGTDFQRRVWDGLRAIPYGETWSYAGLADRVGNRKACRAVGLANGRNPIGIIVPCHRVIGADGSLTGYGGGLERKTWLLEHEVKHRP